MKRATIAILALSLLHAKRDSTVRKHPAQLLVENIRNTAKWFGAQLKQNSHLYQDDDEASSEREAISRREAGPRCSPENVIRKLQDHIKNNGTLNNIHNSNDRCINSYFGERESFRPHDTHHHNKDTYEPGYNPKKDDEPELICEYPSKRMPDGKCVPLADSPKTNSGTYRPPYDYSAPPTISYSMRSILQKGAEMYKNVAESPLANAISNSYLENNNRPPNEYSSGYPSHDNGYNNSNNWNSSNSWNNTPPHEDYSTSPGNTILPMYCSLSSNKIVPYIISYGPPDKSKKRMFVNFPTSETLRDENNSGSPLKKLNVTDTVLTSPLTLASLTDIASKIQMETSSSKIIHITINDTPIIRVSQEHLLHPMCTDGTLCLLESKCMSTSDTTCENYKVCAPPTIQGFIKSIPVNYKNEKTSMVVYSALKKEFSIERLFIENQQIHPHNIEYISIEANLLENSPVSAEVVKKIQSAILESRQHTPGSARPGRASFLIESNNSRGFIIFLLIKQILEDNEHHAITETIKAQMRNVYMQIFKNEIQSDLAASTVTKDIDALVTVLNESTSSIGNHFANQGSAQPYPYTQNNSYPGSYPQQNNMPPYSNGYPNNYPNPNAQSTGNSGYNPSGPYNNPPTGNQMPNGSYPANYQRNNHPNNYGYNPNNMNQPNQNYPDNYRQNNNYNR
ncbi:hypothetical protein NEPAR06_1723 [Nematocida parisii]|nr:hypothetical protein NEPAR04_0553 [Nematocida parisii]KAI5155317.1 hypothetical protein NEPAR06_1723 [Nematocida parisii]KAI5158016.1 hypothetical protein NEPAR05_1790 [Nematocida parisii]